MARSRQLSSREESKLVGVDLRLESREITRRDWKASRHTHFGAQARYKPTPSEAPHPA